MADAAPLRERSIDAWYRPLNNGGLEIMCKTPTLRMRASGQEDTVWSMVERFEELTGLTVNCDRRPRRRPTVPRGQLDMLELQSGDSE